MLRNDDIRNVSFRKAFVGGYKPEDVDAFVANVQASFEKLICENNNLMMAIRKAEQELKKFYSEESSIRSVIRDLKNVTDKSILDAETKAKDIISDATKTSEEMINKAKEEVSIQEEISKNLKSESAKLKESLESIYAQHMRFLNQLPSFAESKVKNKNFDTSVENKEDNSTTNDYQNSQPEYSQQTTNYVEKEEPTVEDEYYNNSSYSNTDYSESTNTYNNSSSIFDKYTTMKDEHETSSYHKDENFEQNNVNYINHSFENKKEYKPFDNIFKAKVKSDTSQKFNILDVDIAGGRSNKYDGIKFGPNYKTSSSILDMLRGKR